ncbi:PLP-dependent transferase [Pseudovirgaria hyperparasitica]|uniref:PLP-dependent transferase n=1 Tax=Pseudovirgaria hyperparasitica TaxID=470096 RepID=A0A6A6W7N5_9PEZI|nr:PLP-dependent transferase [Pseudovirgaria hyperparasitica]KAF2758219.1 PLP-dependent transferase [Pseudovirgaria hyperparasitica]
MATNGFSKHAAPHAHAHAHAELDQEPPLQRAEEVEDLLTSMMELIIPFIRAADDHANTMTTTTTTTTKPQTPNNETANPPRTVLVEHHPPEELKSLLNLSIPRTGTRKPGLLASVAQILRYSVNTWDQGFMDKLYSSTNAIGLAAELLLAVLNTNAHVYAVSPVLTLVEKHTTALLARLFFGGGGDADACPFAGGISQPGGSASNASAIVVARNTLFPETKNTGNAGRRFVLFTSAHGHYSIEKAAQMYGFGRDAVRCVPVDTHGRMQPAALDAMISAAKQAGETPFLVNATAGTTVLGSFDPFEGIADVCGRHGVWMHVDGSWGGGVVFNERLRGSRLRGCERADSVAVTPHKMLQVPMTCSFLVVRDLRCVWRAMSLPAGYLFHTDPTSSNAQFNPATTLYDLADLTPQCGRRADSLKLYLALQYHGLDYYSAMLDRAFATAAALHARLAAHPDFVMVPYSTSPTTTTTTTPQKLPAEPPTSPPCLQVTFHHAPGGLSADADANSAYTEALIAGLVPRGWMVDYAPGEKGKFVRVVVNAGTRAGTVDGFVRAVEEVGRELLGRMCGGRVGSTDSMQSISTRPRITKQQAPFEPEAQ